MHDRRNPKTIRLFDLEPYESVEAWCPCGTMVEFPPGFLQRRHKIPSDTLVYDLQWRVKCEFCKRPDGYTIVIVDKRNLTDSAKVMPRTVVVQGEARVKDVRAVSTDGGTKET